MRYVRIKNHFKGTVISRTFQYQEHFFMLTDRKISEIDRFLRKSIHAQFTKKAIQVDFFPIQSQSFPVCFLP
jgi:hypothetical protein